MLLHFEPLVARGLSTDPKIQVGFYGTPEQVLRQQGRIGGKLFLYPYPENSSLAITKSDGDSCRETNRRLLDVCHAQTFLGGKNGVNKCIDQSLRQGGDK